MAVTFFVTDPIREVLIRLESDGHHELANAVRQIDEERGELQVRLNAIHALVQPKE